MVSQYAVSFSRGNDKMGAIPSLSLPPIITCSPIACRTCGKKCYARRMYARRKNVKNSYDRNLEILLNDKKSFWMQVDLYIKACRFFRFGVSGDIYDYDYLKNMVKVAKNNEHCEMLCFTKKYDLCNKYIKKNGDFPKNLHVIYSGWVGLTVDNPYNLPEAHVLLKNGQTTAKDGARYCSGSCYECAVSGCNCWSIGKGEQLIFREH